MLWTWTVGRAPAVHVICDAAGEIWCNEHVGHDVDDQQTPLLRVSLVVMGKFDPDRLSEAIGLPYDRASRQGEPVSPGNRMTVKKTSWWLRTANVSDFYAEPLVEQLLAHIAKHETALVSQCQTQNLTMTLSVVGRWKEGVFTPAISFSAAQIAVLHRLGANIDVDLYGP